MYSGNGDTKLSLPIVTGLRTTPILPVILPLVLSVITKALSTFGRFKEDFLRKSVRYEFGVR